MEGLNNTTDQDLVSLVGRGAVGGKYTISVFTQRFMTSSEFSSLFTFITAQALDPGVVEDPRGT